MTFEQVLHKRSAEVQGMIVGAIRHLRVSGEQTDRDATFALVADSAFRHGVAFALRRLAGEAEADDVLKPLAKARGYREGGER